MKDLTIYRQGSPRIHTNNNFDFISHKLLWAKNAGINYVYNEQLKDILPEIVKYFNGHKCRYDLKKGLFIYGNLGVGKTTIFDITRMYLNDVSKRNINAYKISSIEKIINHFKTENDLDIYGYNVKADERGIYKAPINLLINEIGTEMSYQIKNYGSSFNDEFNSMLMARYEVFIEFGKLTHATSNVTPYELFKFYDEKLVDRFIEMFNFIELKGKSFRK